jgi:radical SAM protein with 4Fe4S-binding SPASM domain
MAIDSVFESIKAKKRAGEELSSIENDLCGPERMLLESLHHKKFDALMGACFFDSRLYVDAMGGFHICEKINSHFQFGNAFDGFDYNRMAEIASQYIELLNNNCRDCEVRYLCNKCYIHFAKEGTFQVSEEYCRKEKKAVKKIMERAISFQEK